MGCQETRNLLAPAEAVTGLQYAGFDVLIACAFNYDAHSTDFNKLGRVPVLKARMNADLHMAEDLKNTGKGNLFVIFGEPDIDILDAEGGQVQVKVNGVDPELPSAWLASVAAIARVGAGGESSLRIVPAAAAVVIVPPTAPIRSAISSAVRRFVPSSRSAAARS